MKSIPPFCQKNFTNVLPALFASGAPRCSGRECNNRVPSAQIEHLAEEAGPLVEALPRALKRAVANDKVPNDLVQDILWLASRIEPHVEQLKKQIEKLPEQAEEILDNAEEYVDKAAEVALFPPFPPQRTRDLLYSSQCKEERRKMLQPLGCPKFVVLRYVKRVTAVLGALLIQQEMPIENCSVRLWSHPACAEKTETTIVCT